MKRILFIIILGFISNLYSQIINSTNEYQIEIFLLAKSSSNPTDFTNFTMEAVSQVWGSDNPGGGYSNLYTFLTDEYDELSGSVVNDNLSKKSGWDFVTSINAKAPIFGYGKYKFTVDLGSSEKYFYLDYRDDKCGFYPPLETTGHPLDLWIKYNHDLNKFEINSYSGQSVNPNWEDVTEGSTIKIWEIKGIDVPYTGKFEPYAPKYLDYMPVNGKPNLTWQHHLPADDYWGGYKIYRSISSSGSPSSFTLISETSKYVTSFTDNNLSLTGNETAYYKAKAKNTYALSEYSNQVNATSPTGPPATPNNFNLQTVPFGGTKRPKLTWTKNSELDLSGYKIERKINSGNWSTIHTATTDETEYIDMAIIIWENHNTQTAYYRMRAFDIGNLYSPYTSTKSVNFKIMFKENNSKKEFEVVKEYALDSNYPNPFNPATQISYQIPKDSFVNLIVYNSLGQEIAKLVNQHQSSGKYSVKFNANNLPSGVYIYKLHAGEFSSVKKMLLTK